MKRSQKRITYISIDTEYDVDSEEGVNDSYENAMEDAFAGILAGRRNSWFDLGVTYDNAGLQRRAEAAYARAAKLGDIKAIIEYSDRMWAVGRRAKAIQERSREVLVCSDDDPVESSLVRRKELVLKYWIEICHRDLREETLAGLTEMDPGFYGDDYAHWLVARGRYPEAVSLLRSLILEEDCYDLCLPLGNILKEHGETDDAIAAYGSGIAHGDYYSAYNLGLLMDRLGDVQKARHLIRLAASHEDRHAVAWLRWDRRQQSRRRRSGM